MIHTIVVEKRLKAADITVKGIGDVRQMIVTNEISTDDTKREIHRHPQCLYQSIERRRNIADTLHLPLLRRTAIGKGTTTTTVIHLVRRDKDITGMTREVAPGIAGMTNKSARTDITEMTHRIRAAPLAHLLT